MDMESDTSDSDMYGIFLYHVTITSWENYAIKKRYTYLYKFEKSPTHACKQCILIGWFIYKPIH